jgi:hypothetical protein
VNLLAQVQDNLKLRFNANFLKKIITTGANNEEYRMAIAKIVGMKSRFHMIDLDGVGYFEG